MAFTQVNRIAPLIESDPGLRIELVDNWHPRWAGILSAIDRMGERAKLHLDEDGWLSPRQVLLVAFDQDDFAGHLCFRIETVTDEKGAPSLDANLQSFASIEDVKSDLVRLARERASQLRCKRFIGLD